MVCFLSEALAAFGSYSNCPDLPGLVYRTTYTSNDGISWGREGVFYSYPSLGLVSVGAQHTLGRFLPVVILGA